MSEKIVELDLDSDDDEKVLKELEAANALLKVQEEKQLKEKAEREKQERKRKIQMLRDENLKLSVAMGGDIGGTKNKKQNEKLPKTIPQTKVKSAKLTTKKSLSDQDESWLPAFKDHLSKNQVRAAQFTPAEEQLYDGIDIKTIRKIPEVGSEVERLLSLIKAKVPSLDSRPSLVAGQVLPKPNPLDVGPGAELEEFVYHRRPDGTER